MSEIKAIGSIKGSLSSESTLKGKLSGSGASLTGELSSGGMVVETYKGDYEVTPDVENARTLNTAKKYLKENIVVKQIPYSETTNPSNGLTAYIGKDVLTNV